MKEHPWILAEPGFGDMRRQTARLLRRGTRRPWLVLLVGALVAAGLVGAVALVRDTYRPRVVLRVVEADQDAESAPTFKRRLAEYVREGVLTAEPLLELVHRYSLYPNAPDRRAALDAFRRDIDVRVYQNYFVEARGEGDAPRSARVAIGYRSNERAKAIHVTRELGALVVARVRAGREEQADRTATAARDAAAVLQDALIERYREIAKTREGLTTKVTPALQVELVSLVGSLPALERQVEKAEKHAATLELGAAYENHGIGLRFDVAEDATAPQLDRRSSLKILGAVLAFMSGLPLIVLGVGASQEARGGT